MLQYITAASDAPKSETLHKPRGLPLEDTGNCAVWKSKIPKENLEKRGEQIEKDYGEKV